MKLSELTGHLFTFKSITRDINCDKQGQELKSVNWLQLARFFLTYNYTVFEKFLESKRFVTDLAFERPFAAMYSHVRLQVGSLGKF